MNKLPSISEAEYEVMKIIWANAPISTNQVVEKLMEADTRTEKTIQTFLARLVKKGVLAYEKKGRVFVYTPLIKEEDYVDYESHLFLNKFYAGTLNSMVINFLNRNKLSKNEIIELQNALYQKRNENKQELDWLD